MPSTLTNKLGLPDTVYRACLYDTHKVAGDLSVSQIIENPRVIMLKRANKYEEDVSDRLYMLMGTALHHIIERANMNSAYKRAFDLVIEKLQEESKKLLDEGKKEGMTKVHNYLTKLVPYFFPELEDRYLFEKTQRAQIGDKVLYGTPDLFDKTTGILYDYKFCSVYSYMYPEARQKWEAQTNVYAWLLSQAGYEVKEIRIVAFFRDYQGKTFVKKKEYPSAQIMEIPIKLRTMPQMATYITNRMKLHVEAEETNIMPMCTGRERWATADQYAVMTPGVKKALRVFPTKPECEVFMLQNSDRYDGMFIQDRPGLSNKCENFCPVKQFCDQYKSELEYKRKMSDNE